MPSALFSSTIILGDVTQREFSCVFRRTLVGIVDDGSTADCSMIEGGCNLVILIEDPCVDAVCGRAA